MKSQKISSAWIALTFSPEILITSLSPGVEDFAGCLAQEMIGHPITQFLADKTVFEMPHILNTVREEGWWEGEIEYRNYVTNGIRSYGIILPLSGPENSNSGYLLQSKCTESRNFDGTESRNFDGTESRNFERDSLSVYSEVGSRVRKLVHDLNNPLAVTMGSTQLLALNHGFTGKVQSDIEKLYSELERMAHVVEKLHRYAISLCEKTPDSTVEADSIQNSA